MDRKLSRVQMAIPDEEESGATEKDLAYWVKVLKKYNEKQKVVCKKQPIENKKEPRKIKRFITGSDYEGTWDSLGMSGFGHYVINNGPMYIGEIEDGLFNGNGALEYANGEVLKGTWDRGRMVERTLTFANGLEYEERGWQYCKMPDRRFTVEYENDLQPGGKTILTADQPTKEIPDGYHDCGDGFYDPVNKIIYDTVTNTIKRAPKNQEQKWIKDNCRYAPDDPVGPRPELYEEWAEPQLNPEPPPAPASVSRATKFRDFESFESLDANDFYIVMRKSRQSTMSGRSRERSSTVKHRSLAADRRSSVARERFSTMRSAPGSIRATTTHRFRWMVPNIRSS